MKVAHWSLKNKSGMARVAESLVEAERKLGIDSHFVDAFTAPDEMADADIHVNHTHLNDTMRRKLTKPLKMAWIIHGTPEHVFKTAVEAGATKSYGHPDGWMLHQHNLQTSDAIITFWPRHQAIWKSLCDKHTPVHCIPLGVDKTFWKPQPTQGKFDGAPSVFTSENCHDIKWPLDLFVAWPWVWPRLKGDGRLHAAYLPNDMHRWFLTLANRNGCAYKAHISPIAFDHTNLRNAFCSIDYFVGLVRYGDFNRLCLEANACGAKTISYRGNPYSDFWITEGDQRSIADELVGILNGDVAPRQKESVPDVLETAKAMIEIYNKLA